MAKAETFPRCPGPTGPADSLRGSIGSEQPGKGPTALVRAASGDPEAVVELSSDLDVDGVTVPPAEWGRIRRTRSRLSGRPSQTLTGGTALHEGAHWFLGHVEDPQHRHRVMSCEQDSDEVTADEYALDILLEQAEIAGALVEPRADVRRALLEDCWGHGGCQDRR